MVARRPIVRAGGRDKQLPAGDTLPKEVLPALDASDVGAEPAIEAGTNAQYLRGDKTWQTFAASVRSAVLTGLSVATDTAIAATDSVLGALGKLQAQITAHIGSGGDAHAVATTNAAGFMAAADKTKLNGVAAGATANSSDAALLNRANHTGTQTLATISDAGTAAALNANAFAQPFLSAGTLAAQQAALSLVPVSSVVATTDSRVLTVGYMGIGGLAPAIDAATDLTTQRTGFRYQISGAGNPFPLATPIINVAGTRSMAWAARSSRSFVYTYGETPVLMEHWTDKNLFKQEDTTDATVGAVVLNGGHGIGGFAVVCNTLADIEDASKPSRFFYSSVADSNNPYGRIGAGININYPGTGRMAQIFCGISGATTGIFVRTSNSSVALNAPVELLHTGNFTPGNYSTTAQMNAAIVSATTGAPVSSISSNYTLSVSDWTSGAPYIRVGAATSITVPTHASAAIPVGAEITIRKSGSGSVTLTPAAGVTINPPAGGSLVVSQNMTVTLKKAASNTWDLIGQTVAA